jgi:hypothetical protein
MFAARCNPYKAQTPGGCQGETRMTNDKAPITNRATTVLVIGHWSLVISYEYASSITLYTVRTL